MEVLSEDDIYEKIDNYSNEKLRTSEEVLDDEDKKEILKVLFPYTNMEEHEIIDTKFTKFNIYRLDKFSFLKYRKEGTKSSNVLVVFKDYKPLFKLERICSKKNQVKFVKSIHTIYEKDTSKILNKLIKESLIDGNVEIKKVKVMDTSSSGYNDSYEFYIKDNKVVSIKNKDEMYLENEVGFTKLIALSSKKINKVSGLIMNRFNDILQNEEVKEYKLKRKFDTK